MDKGTSINSIPVIASEAKQSRNLDKSTPVLDRHVAARLATTVFGGIHKSYGYAFGVLLLASQGAWASAPDVSGMSCMNGELTVVTGAAFSARCAGDLRFEASGVIEASESISLVASGSLWMAGTLSAPRIELIASQDISLTGGLFSGSPAYFPEVNAVSYADSPSGTLRTFGDIVADPFIHPVYGAVIFTSFTVEVRPATNLEIHEFVLLQEETASPVPEPAMPLMFGLGAVLVAWKRTARSMSRMVHRARNRNVTLEN